MKTTALLFLLLALGSSLSAAQPPNVIFILADDMGSGDLGCCGADPKILKTPHCDRLAREGMRFTDASAPASICTPTRYAALTGRYCWRTPRKFGTAGDTSPLMIHPQQLTTASLLKGFGYRTACIGKWHLGIGNPPHSEFTGELAPGPRAVGFDHFYGIAAGHDDASGVYVENEHVEGLRSTTMKPFPRAYYQAYQYLGLDAPQRVNEDVTPHLTDHVIAWLQQQKSDTPFYLHYTPIVPHVPCTPTKKNLGASGCGLYGDWILDLDDSVGRILAELDRLQLADNTLIIFTSDNGSVVAADSLKGGSQEIHDAWNAGLRSNGGLRSRKHSIFEGGFRVPFLVRWPGKVKPGSVSAEMISLVDVLATIADIVSFKLPPPARSAEDSHSFLPALLGKTTTATPRPAMIEQSHEGVLAIRRGPWKWIEGKPADPNAISGRASNYVPQLYNLHTDPAEQTNLLDQHPEVAKELSALLNQYRQQGYSRRE